MCRIDVAIADSRQRDDYGDIYPTSEIGRIVSMMSSFMGIAIVALPTGIITAGYMRELSREKWD
mgnify:CR=1 FL=1